MKTRADVYREGAAMLDGHIARMRQIIDGPHAFERAHRAAVYTEMLHELEAVREKLHKLIMEAED